MAQATLNATNSTLVMRKPNTTRGYPAILLMWVSCKPTTPMTLADSSGILGLWPGLYHLEISWTRLIQAKTTYPQARYR